MVDVITANRLTDGLVVFFDGRGGWVEAFAEGAVFETAEATAEALTRAKKSEADNEVVEPYAVELAERNGHYAPKALREAIRVNGPTIRRDLGKQAEGRGLAAAEGAHVSL